MRITKRLPPLSDVTNESVAEEFEEDDEEALGASTTPTFSAPLVAYDIIHSPSYQVPVLYMSFRNLPSERPPSPEEVYRMIVPDTHKASMQAVGNMGALSLAEHPVTGMPACFVHPCRTREAMEPILRGRSVKAVEYVVLWLGTIGASVGLDVPLALTTKLSNASEDV